MAARRSIGLIWLAIRLAPAYSQASESARDLARELVRTMKVDEQAEQLVERQ
jgi:hypothetical protein